MAEILIHARKLNSYYGASHILRDIDFSVAAGETIGLMGRNGMGKSTLLKSIMGLVRPRGGSVQVMGRDMTGAPPYEIARLGVAYVPEGRGIFGNLSVVENLKMAARAGQTEASRVRARAGQDWNYDRVLDTFPRLKERLRQEGGKLSGGEQQMLTIARGLMAKPKLMLIDEPSEGLAPTVVDLISAALQRLKQSGATLLLVEQNYRMALSLLDDACVLAQGRVVFAGSKAEISAAPEMISNYIAL